MEQCGRAEHCYQLAPQTLDPIQNIHSRHPPGRHPLGHSPTSTVIIEYICQNQEQTDALYLTIFQRELGDMSVHYHFDGTQ